VDDAVRNGKIKVKIRSNYVGLEALVVGATLVVGQQPHASCQFTPRANDTNSIPLNCKKLKARWERSVRVPKKAKMNTVGPSDALEAFFNIL
jgi:hypothetical protein